MALLSARHEDPVQARMAHEILAASRATAVMHPAVVDVAGGTGALGGGRLGHGDAVAQSAARWRWPSGAGVARTCRVGFRAPCRCAIFCAGAAHWTHAWKQGFNLGPRHGVLHACRDRLRKLADQHSQKVSLIGWSLGGVYARELAKEVPDLVRCVVTLGSPFAGHPRDTNAWRVYEWFSGQSVHDNPALREHLRQAPPVPTTSIFSRSDGVVAGTAASTTCCHTPRTSKSPPATSAWASTRWRLYVVADRLRQDPADWQRFDTSGARSWFFKHAEPPEAGHLSATPSPDRRRQSDTNSRSSATRVNRVERCTAVCRTSRSRFQFAFRLVSGMAT